MSNMVELVTLGPSWKLHQLNGRGASVSFTSQHLLGEISNLHWYLDYHQFISSQCLKAVALIPKVKIIGVLRLFMPNVFRKHCLLRPFFIETF